MRVRIATKAIKATKPPREPGPTTETRGVTIVKPAPPQLLGGRRLYLAGIARPTRSAELWLSLPPPARRGWLPDPTPVVGWPKSGPPRVRETGRYLDLLREAPAPGAGAGPAIKAIKATEPALQSLLSLMSPFEMNYSDPRFWRELHEERVAVRQYLLFIHNILQIPYDRARRSMRVTTSVSPVRRNASNAWSSVRPSRCVPLAFSARITSHPAVLSAACWNLVAQAQVHRR
jgi:hypothetical protein